MRSQQSSFERCAYLMTYESIVGAADGISRACIARADTNDGERRAVETDRGVGAAELVGDELKDVGALELLEVDVLGLYTKNVRDRLREKE